LFRASLDRYDQIGCLSERQRDFYLSHGVARSKLRLLDPALPAVPRTAGIGGKLYNCALRWILDSGRRLVISSGYAEKFYNHDWLLEALAQSSAFADVSYLICCYGPRTPFLSELERKARGMTNAKVVFGLSPGEFDMLLRRADVYVRPSDVDSFGIAVWDADANEIAVVASDVCRRPARARIHPSGARQTFLRLLREALDGVSNAPAPSTSSTSTTPVVDFLGVPQQPSICRK